MLLLSLLSSISIASRVPPLRTRLIESQIYDNKIIVNVEARSTSQFNVVTLLVALSCENELTGRERFYLALLPHPDEDIHAYSVFQSERARIYPLEESFAPEEIRLIELEVDIGDDINIVTCHEAKTLGARTLEEQF